MPHILKRFLRNDSGVVLADYVVMTAMAMALAVAVVGATGSGVIALSEAIPLSQAAD
ncbi:MAG TPA: hypothetical protein VLA78_07095 [Paracoccaceae bacterium]|nr:hypothetical protein [Paracoccaceae bacterium]